MGENRPKHQYLGENEIAEKDNHGELQGDGKKTQSDGFGGDLPPGMEKYPREFPHRRVNEENNQPERERRLHPDKTATAGYNPPGRTREESTQGKPHLRDKVHLRDYRDRQLKSQYKLGGKR